MARFEGLVVGKEAAPKKRSWMEEDEASASVEPVKESGDGDETLMAALEDFSRASKAGDVTAMAKAFRAAFVACEASPHVEADDEV